MTYSALYYLRLSGLALLGAAIALFLIVQSYFFVQVAWWSVVPPIRTQFMFLTLQKDIAPYTHASVNNSSQTQVQAATKATRQKRKKNAQQNAPGALVDVQTLDEKPLQYRWVEAEAIAVHIKRAVIASEDSDFTSHAGVDWQGIERAWKKNQRRGKRLVGGSTISQQLAKNLLLNSERSYVRKAQELIITKMLEFWMTKERVLTLYLNVAQWGDHLYGIEAAAQHYFRVSARQLSAAQAARLAAMLPAPVRYGKNPYSAYMNQRTQTILARMPASVLPDPQTP